MIASREHIAGGRILYAVAITLSVLLIGSGMMRAAGFSGMWSTKKRSPRAVIETTVKDAQEAGSKKHALAAICQSAFILNLPDQVASVVERGISKSSLIISGPFNARAPPYHFT